MYQNSYVEVIENSAETERNSEGMALEHSIELMEKAQKAGMTSKEAIEAQFFINRLWVYFIEDLSSTTNALPEQLKADIISIGIWVLRETERIRRGQSSNFQGLIEVSRTIKEGLK